MRSVSLLSNPLKQIPKQEKSATALLTSPLVTSKTYIFVPSGQHALSALSVFKLLRSSSLICTWSSSFSVITCKLIAGLNWSPLCFSVKRDAKLSV